MPKDGLVRKGVLYRKEDIRRDLQGWNMTEDMACDRSEWKNAICISEAD